MKTSLASTFLALIFGLTPFSYRAEPVLGQSVALWQTDVCDKIFSDSTPGEETAVHFQAAANEYESALIGVRTDADLESATIAVSDLSNPEQSASISADNVRVREVGTLHIDHNTSFADNIITRKAPCDIPEILYDRSTIAFQKDESKGIWLTLFVPKGTPAGKYVGKLTLSSGEFSKQIDVEAEVFPFELQDARNLHITNWWSPSNIAKYHKVEYLSEEYWIILEKYIQNMGDHRQDTLDVNWVPNEFVTASINQNGDWEFNFQKFDRLADLAAKYGVLERLELAHVGWIDRKAHQVAFRQITIYDARKKENVKLNIDEWLAPVLKAFCNHLRERGLFERAMIHVADEPYLPDVDSWRAASAKIRAIEPELKQIDAIEAINFDDCLDVWVPKISHFDRWRSAFEQRRDKGEFWYYICCHPYGEAYPNRFMDIPGVRIRALHWINYSENLSGYLHWGFNYWRDDPYGPPTKDYGPGDTHVVYPGEGGPVDSVRWEIERESVEDYEYLKTLENKIADIKKEYPAEKTWFLDPKSRPEEIARKVAPTLASSTLDYNVLNQARLEAVNEIKNATGASVRLVVQTYPGDDSVSYIGPTLFEIYGITTPGAEVTINGKPVAVDSEGFFKLNRDLRPAGDYVLEFVATLNGQTAKTTRVFHVK